MSREQLQSLAAMIDSEGGSSNLVSVEPNDVAALPTMGRAAGRTAMLRLLLPELIPDISRVLYLDADTMVVEPLDELWNTTLGDSPIAAVNNVVDPALHSRLSSIGLADPKSVFNTGVVLIDLEAVRRESAFARAIRFIADGRASGLWWPDQDALNVVFAGRWKRLHPRWNAMNSLWTWPDWAAEVFGEAALHEARENPAILHFEGPSIRKPWHFLSSHPWRHEYRRLLSLTPWADVKLEEQSLPFQLIARMPESWKLPAYWRYIRLRRLFGRGARDRDSGVDG